MKKALKIDQLESPQVKSQKQVEIYRLCYDG